MEIQEEQDQLEYHGKLYQVIWNKTNGDVWFSESESLGRTNIGQQKPAKTMEEAKEIALLMLKHSGR